MNEIEKKEEEICKIFRVIDNWAKKAVSTNKFDGAGVYNPTMVRNLRPPSSTQATATSSKP